jgi:uncharacterized protein
MHLLNIKTQGYYYLYDIKKKQLYGSNPIIYSIYKYIETNRLLFDEINENDITTINRSLRISKSNIRKSIDKILYLNNISKSNVDRLLESNFLIDERQIIKSLANVKQIIIEVTEKCNFSCYYCCYGSLYENDQKRIKNLDINKCLKALSQLMELLNSENNYSIHNNIVVSFYGGEPLLNFNAIDKIIQYLDQYRKDTFKINYSMTTNAYYIKKYISFLVKNNFKISISIDGNNAQNEYRKTNSGMNTFTHVFDNILYINKNYPDFFAKNVDFISVLHDKNDPISLQSYFKKINKDTFLTSLSTNNVKEAKKKEFEEIYNPGSITIDELIQLKNTDVQLYNIIINKLYSINNKLYSLGYQWDIFGDELVNWNNITDSCFLFQSKIFLSVSGYLYPCEKTNRNFIFGTYNSDKLIFFIDKIKNYYSTIQQNVAKKCYDCFIRRECKFCFFSDPDMFDNCVSCKKTKSDYITELTENISAHEKSVENMFKEIY